MVNSKLSKFWILMVLSRKEIKRIINYAKAKKTTIKIIGKSSPCRETLKANDINLPIKNLDSLTEKNKGEAKYLLSWGNSYKEILNKNKE